jgi:hypothetical protein
MSEAARETPRIALEHLLALSDAMLEFAMREDWDEVARYEQVRSLAIKRFFEVRMPDLSADLVAGAIDHILRGDREISRLAATRRDILAESALELSHNRGHAKVYAEASRTWS